MQRPLCWLVIFAAGCVAPFAGAVAEAVVACPGSTDIQIIFDTSDVLVVVQVGD